MNHLEMIGSNWKKSYPKYIFPGLKDLTLSTQQNTTRVCLQCRGTRFNEIKHNSGRITMRTCVVCKGSGVVHRC